MEEINKQMLLFLAEENATFEGTVLDPEDQTVMSRATFFRATKEVEQDGLLIRIPGGKASIHLAFQMALVHKFEMDKQIGKKLLHLQREVETLTEQFFDNYYEHRRLMAMICAECGDLEVCIKNRRIECIKCEKFDTPPSREALDKIARLLMERDLPSRPSVVSAETVSTETCIVAIDQDLGSMKMQVSAETTIQEAAIPSLEKDPDQESKAPPTPPSHGQDRTENLRGVMRHIMATSKRPEDEGQKVRVMKKEVWALWTKGMIEKYGADFEVGKLAGKDSTLVVQLIAGYGLELTKKIVVVYLGHWDELKALNTWMKDAVPTVGMLWHFRQSVVAVATGKASWDVSKRTADEYVEDDGSGNNGRWPDREGPKATSPA